MDEVKPDLTAKWLEVLKELLPNALHVGQLVNSSNPANARRFIAESQVAAAKLKLTVQVVEVGAPDDPSGPCSDGGRPIIHQRGFKGG